MGIQTKNKYDKLKSKSKYLDAIKIFYKEIENYYRTGLEYLQQWTAPLSKFDIFSWMSLNDLLQWQDVEKIVLYLREKDI